MAKKRINIYIEQKYYKSVQRMAAQNPIAQLANVSCFLDRKFEIMTRAERAQNKKKKGRR